MAAIVFTRRLHEAGLDDVRVSSAGIGPWHAGQGIDSRAGAALADAGYDTKHRAAQVDEDHLSADLLLAMDSGHFHELCREVGDESKVRMFRSFDPLAGEDLDVPDPYYGGASGFTDLLACIERSMPALLDFVR
jgi:protein-tyrosine phosphatase